MIPISFSEPYDKINHLHIELTNRCNAACPMCLRFHQSSPLLRPDLILNDITFEQFKTWFRPKLLKQIIHILFCGVHGDPIIARDVYEITEYIMDSNPSLNIQFNTNGGMRNIEWWSKFGKLLNRSPSSRVVFSIDGLEDTNHLYRRNVQWKKLMLNVESFIQAGGTAYWDYLIFKHNEHQIEEAKDLAKSLGFKEFIPKKALGVDDGVDLRPLGVVNKNGELEYTIEAPIHSENRNLKNYRNVGSTAVNLFTTEQYKQLKENGEIQKTRKWMYDTIYDNLKNENYTTEDSCDIKCKSLRNNIIDIFIDNFGNVLPCCYVGTHFNGNYTDNGTLQLHHELRKYGLEKFNLNYNSFEEIINRRHLDNLFVNSWSKKSIVDGKLLFCSTTCGKTSAIDRVFSHKGRTKL